MAVGKQSGGGIGKRFFTLDFIFSSDIRVFVRIGSTRFDAKKWFSRKKISNSQMVPDLIFRRDARYRRYKDNLKKLLIISFISFCKFVERLLQRYL